MNLNWSEIDRLVEQGYIKKVTEDGLSLYNYTRKTQYECKWTEETEVCRGLIVDKDRNIVALPFCKIFNWMEGGRRSSLNSHIVNVTEKVDGQLGIMFQKDGRFFITTRGAFNSPQAQWATEFLYDNFYLDGLSDDYTLLFEIISPQHRVVIDYNGREDLVLLAARNKNTGDYLRFFPELYNLANKYGFSLTKTYQFNKITDIIERMLYLPENEEGHVVEFSDGSRFKFKGNRYLELHKLICGLSFRKVLDAYFSGKLEYYYKQMPEEFHPQMKSWENEIEEIAMETYRNIHHIFNIAPPGTGSYRKSFALWAKSNYPEIISYLFCMLDDKSIDHLIYRDILKHRGKETSDEDEA